MERNITTPSRIKYPIHEEPMFFSKPLLDLFLNDPDYNNLLALYVFYYYTAKWQGTNQPKATVNYVARGVHWGVDKVRMVRSRLKQYGLIEDIVQRDEYGRVIGYFVKLNFTFTRLGVQPVQVKSDINTLKPNRKKILSEKNKIPPPKELVEIYCSQRRNGISAQAFIDFYDSKGWMVGKNRMKDWQAAIRTWEQNDKDKNNKYKPKFIDDPSQGRFYLQSDGEYYHKSGQKYIP